MLRELATTTDRAALLALLMLARAAIKTCTLPAGRDERERVQHVLRDIEEALDDDA